MNTDIFNYIKYIKMEDKQDDIINNLKINALNKLLNFNNKVLKYKGKKITDYLLTFNNLITNIISDIKNDKNIDKNISLFLIAELNIYIEIFNDIKAIYSHNFLK